MLIKPSRGEKALDPQGNRRYSCPHCGAGSVLYLLPGEPASSADGKPEPRWVQRTGEVEINRNRWCGGCGESWTQIEMPTLGLFTIRGIGASALTLTPIPVLSLGMDLCVDITLTRPGRLVRVLGRQLEPDSPRRLAEFLVLAAQSDHPELSVPRLVDDVAGWEFAVLRSAEDRVDLMVQVYGDPTDPDAEPDGLALALPRTALRAAADRAQWWLR